MFIRPYMMYYNAATSIDHFKHLIGRMDMILAWKMTNGVSRILRRVIPLETTTVC